MSTNLIAPDTSNRPMWRPERCGRVALVLQGGGALGAYQAGVYQALHEAGVEPDWVSGVSIGAINSAIIAGNAPEQRLERLRMFWERVTDRTVWLHNPEGDIFRRARNATSSFMAAMLGQPGYFKPHAINPWFSPAGASTATSYYDNEPLRATLLELVDFDMLNQKTCRFSVGTVNVLSGNFAFFDNATTEITPDHIMASGAIPPALAPMKIGSDYFWDGGIVSNTPLQHLLAQDDNTNCLVFQVDLFSAHGPLPRTIQDVEARHKDIMHSSRTRQVTDMFQRLQRWKGRAHRALLKVPEADLTEEERGMLERLADLPVHTIIQLIRQPQAHDGTNKIYEFSGTTMRENWSLGYEDTVSSLKHKEWLVIPPDNGGIVTYDVHRDRHR
jgi:NTE family protein